MILESSSFHISKRKGWSLMPRIGIYTEIILWCSHSHVAELWMSICIHSTRCPNKFGIYYFLERTLLSFIQEQSAIFTSTFCFDKLFSLVCSIWSNNLKFWQTQKTSFFHQLFKIWQNFLVFFTISNCLESYRMFQRQHFPPKKVFKKYSKTAFPCSF